MMRTIITQLSVICGLANRQSTNAIKPITENNILREILKPFLRFEEAMMSSRIVVNITIPLLIHIFIALYEDSKGPASKFAVRTMPPDVRRSFLIAVII